MYGSKFRIGIDDQSIKQELELTGWLLGTVEEGHVFGVVRGVHFVDSCRYRYITKNFEAFLSLQFLIISSKS